MIREVTKRVRGRERRSLIQVGIRRIQVSSVDKRKVGEIGRKQMLLVDVKINGFLKQHHSEPR